MYLAAAVFGPHLIKGEIVQYFAALASIKNSRALLGQSFHSLILEDEELKDHILHLGDFVYWKRNHQKNYF